VDELFLILTKLAVPNSSIFGAKPGFFQNRPAASPVREILAIANSCQLG
jgi:hypothetical protein